jgi:hypothetical protein
MPRLMIISALAVILSLLFKLFNKTKEEYNSLMFVGLYTIAFYAIIHPYYGGQTRYLFFMYPIVLIIIANSFIMLLKVFHLREKTLSLCCLAFLPILLISSDDFNLYHLINIDQKEVNFREIYNKQLEAHYYQRRDFKSPAQFVNTHRDKNDKVILDIYPPAYYLKDFDYFYRDRRSGAYLRAISIKRGRKEIWQSKQLIKSLKQLTNIIFASKNKIWLIQSHKKFKHYNKLNPRILNLFNQNEVYTSIDGRLRVIELDPEKIKNTLISLNH